MAILYRLPHRKRTGASPVAGLRAVVDATVRVAALARAPLLHEGPVLVSVRPGSHPPPACTALCQWVNLNTTPPPPTAASQAQATGHSCVCSTSVVGADVAVLRTATGGARQGTVAQQYRSSTVQSPARRRCVDGSARQRRAHNGHRHALHAHPRCWDRADALDLPNACSSCAALGAGAGCVGLRVHVAAQQVTQRQRQRRHRRVRCSLCLHHWPTRARKTPRGAGPRPSSAPTPAIHSAAT